jgi:2-oxoglutarate ferredoxin oxidoreductase subunit gamma
MTVKDEEDRFEIRLSGSGGQGLIFAGVILAEAAGVYDGKNVTQTQSYGPEARGGASRADVVIAKGEIFYPKSMKLDVLLALNQESCDKYAGDLKENGILVVDSSAVSETPFDEVYGFPFLMLSRDKIGTPVVANVMALGAIAQLTKIASKEGLIETLRKRAPKGTEEKNIQALELGFEIAKDAQKIKLGME